MKEAAGGIAPAQAAAYVRGRPDYPVVLEEWLRRDLGLGEGKVAIDLGAGTGKFLPRLLAVGAEVIAIEPSVAMRSQLEALFPGVKALAGRAQAMPLDDKSVDAVICAQCFNWFANQEALEEIRRVLKPGGGLGLVWNIRDQTTPWVARLVEIMAPYDPGTPDYESQEWRRAFPADGFSELREHTFPNPQAGPPEKVIIDRVLSVGSIANLPRIQRVRVIARSGKSSMTRRNWPESRRPRFQTRPSPTTAASSPEAARGCSGRAGLAWDLSIGGSRLRPIARPV